MAVSIEPTSAPVHPPQISWIHTALHEALAEALGTFILIIIGTGSGGGRLTGSIANDWEAGTMWSVGVISGTYACGLVSGAHMNPAISLGMVIAGYLPAWKFIHYVIGQLAGGLCGSILVYTFYYGLLNDDLRTFHGGSLESAYLKNSGIFSCKLHSTVSVWRGVYIEAVLTALLVTVVSFVGDPHSILKEYPFVPPFVIALFIGGLISSFGSLTSAWWGSSALPGIRNKNPYWIFILGPLLGSVIGSCAWKAIGSHLYIYAAKQRMLAAETDQNFDESSLLNPLGEYLMEN